MSYISISELRAYLHLADTDTYTPAFGADTLTLASVPFRNTLKTGTEVTVSSTTADPPAPLVEGTVYYVIEGADQVMQLATTSALAEAGTQINLTDDGTGTHSITREDADTDVLEDCINAAEEYIESQTNREFEADTKTYYYLRDALDREDSTILHLDRDCLTVTELLNGDEDATEIVVGHYWLLDRNLGPPYHWIKLTINDGDYWQWDTDCWIAVTGTWGYSATVPADVKVACLHLAAFFYRQRDSQIFDVTAIPDAGVITIPQGIPATVTRVIQRYKRYL